MWRDVTPLPSFCLNHFYYTTSARLAKRFPWHVLSKQRSCSPYSGILINTDVGNPTAPVATPPLSKASPERSRRQLSVFSLFIMGPRLVSFLQSSIESSPCSKFQHPEPQIRALRTFNNVRLRPSGPVDAILRHGGGQPFASRSGHGRRRSRRDARTWARRWISKGGRRRR